MVEKFKEIPIKEIKSIENVRTEIDTEDLSELMQSIKQQGLLEPIGVWRTTKGEYIISYGNRRLQACKKLGWKTITAKILDNLTIEDMLILNMSENLHRKNNSMFEMGRICDLLMQKGLSINEVAVRLGSNHKTIQIAVAHYKDIPDDLKNKVVYMTDKTHMRKKGKIPAWAYTKIALINRELNIGKANVTRLLKQVEREELNLEEIRVLATLLKEGFGLEKALALIDKYSVQKVVVILNKKLKDDLLKEHNLGRSTSKLIAKIVRGEIKPNANLMVAV